MCEFCVDYSWTIHEAQAEETEANPNSTLVSCSRKEQPTVSSCGKGSQPALHSEIFPQTPS